VYHSTLGSRVKKEEEEVTNLPTKEFADIKDTMSSSRGVGGTNLEVSRS
jgi:hypothetical protein